LLYVSALTVIAFCVHFLSYLPCSAFLINFIEYVTDNTNQNHGNGTGNGNGNGGNKSLVGADGKCYQVVRMYVQAKTFYEKIISDKKAKDKKNRRAEQVMAQGTKLTQNMAVTVLLGAITVGCVPQRRNAIVANVKTFLMNIAPVDGVRFECEKPVDESFLPFGLVSENSERERVKEEEREREVEKGILMGLEGEMEMGIGGDEEVEVEVEVDDVEGVGEGEMKIEDAMNNVIGGEEEGVDNTHSGERTGSGSWSDNSEETRQRRGSADRDRNGDLPLSGHAHTDMNCGDDTTADSDTVLTCLSEFDRLHVSERIIFMFLLCWTFTVGVYPSTNTCVFMFFNFGSY
jgi:hypothetical protein